ncbi:MAG: hypothetical protein AB8B74_07640 [Crocinitomicaceae bacterium]
MKNNRTISIIAISVNLISILYKLMQGARAGWETMLPIVATGAVLTIVAVLIQRNSIAWTAVITAILSILFFFLA